MSWGFTYLGLNFNILSGLAHQILILLLNLWSWLLNGVLSLMYLKFNTGYESLEPILSGKNSATVMTIGNVALSYVELIKDNKVLPVVIGTVSIIAIVSIIVRYGYTIFKTYFLNIGNEQSLPTLDFFRRILVAIILSALIPTIVINTFVFTSYLAVSAVSTLDETADTDKIVHLQYLYDHEKYGITPTTYCYVETAQATFGGKDWQALNDKTFPLVLRENGNVEGEKELFDRYCKGELSNAEYSKSSFAYQGIWHKQQPAMVAQTLIDSSDTWPVSIIPLFYDEEYFGDGIGAISYSFAFGEILKAICLGLFSFGVMYRIAKLLADMIASLLMSWYYLQEYVSYANARILGIFMRKMFSIFLTLFYVLVMYAIFLKSVASVEKFDIVHIVITIVLWISYRQGSTVISDIIMPSSSLGMAKKARQTLGG